MRAQGHALGEQHGELPRRARGMDHADIGEEAVRDGGGIGGGGLGVLIFRGVASVDTLQILAGAIPAAALALIADAGMGIVERRIGRR